MMYTVVGDARANNSNFEHKFDSSQSQSYRSVNSGIYNFAYRYGTLNTREVCDYVLIGEKKPPYTFNFLVAYNTSIHYSFDGILGLGCHYPPKQDGFGFDERFSFLNCLQFNKLIERRVFAHQYLNRTYGKFYIDDIPDTIRDYKKCQLSYSQELLYKWYCELNKVSFEKGKEFTVKSSIAFDTGYIDIRAPPQEGENLLNEIISLSGNKCTIEETKINDNDIYKRLICDYNIKISNIPNIHFTVDDFDIILLNNDMFRLVQISNEYKFICKIVLDSRYTYWNIGEPLIKNYDMIFNADDSFIGFKENVNLYGESWLTVFILSIIFVALVIAGVYLFINRKKLFNKGIASDQIEKLKQKEAFEGSQLGEI